MALIAGIGLAGSVITGIFGIFGKRDGDQVTMARIEADSKEKLAKIGQENYEAYLNAFSDARKSMNDYLLSAQNSAQTFMAELNKANQEFQLQVIQKQNDLIKLNTNQQNKIDDTFMTHIDALGDGALDDKKMDLYQTQWDKSSDRNQDRFDRGMTNIETVLQRDGTAQLMDCFKELVKGIQAAMGNVSKLVPEQKKTSRFATFAFAVSKPVTPEKWISQQDYDSLIANARIITKMDAISAIHEANLTDVDPQTLELLPITSTTYRLVNCVIEETKEHVFAAISKEFVDTVNLSLLTINHVVPFSLQSPTPYDQITDPKLKRAIYNFNKSMHNVTVTTIWSQNVKIWAVLTKALK